MRLFIRPRSATCAWRLGMGLLSVIMVFVFVGVPVALVLLLRSDSSAGRQLGGFLGMSESQRRAFPSFPSLSADRDRTQAARDIAQKYGLTYVGHSNEEMERIAHFFLFRYKGPGVVDDLVLGESAAMRESFFTYYDRPQWRSTFAHFTSARLDLPEFRLNGRGFPHRDLTAAAIAFLTIYPSSTRHTKCAVRMRRGLVGNARSLSPAHVSRSTATAGLRVRVPNCCAADQSTTHKSESATPFFKPRERCVRCSKGDDHCAPVSCEQARPGDGMMAPRSHDGRR